MKTYFVHVVLIIACAYLTSATITATIDPSPICNPYAFFGITTVPDAGYTQTNSVPTSVPDLISYYYDTATGDSIQLKAKLNGFVYTLTATYRDFTTSIGRQCTFVSAPTNVVLFNFVLLGKDTAGWKVCDFKLSGSSTNLVEASLIFIAPSTGATLVQIVGIQSFSNGAMRIKAYLSQAANANNGFYDFFLAAGGASSTASESFAKSGGAPAGGMPGTGGVLRGTQNLFLDNAKNCFKMDQSSNNWIAQTTCNAGATQLTTYCYFFTTTVLFNVNSDGFTNGKVFWKLYPNSNLVVYNTVYLQSFGTNTVAIKTITDNIRNVLFLGKQELFWMTFTTTGTVSKSSFLTGVGAVPTQLSGAVKVTLATNKAFFLQSNGIVIAQNTHTAAGSIEYLKTMTITTATSDITTPTSDKQYLFRSKCTSPSITRFIRYTCFGTTFNCISTCKTVEIDGFKYAY